MQQKTITYQSSTIYYRVIGNGKPVMLLHGFGEDGEIWNQQVNFLQEHYTLIVPDLPGSGQSQIITDMSIEGMADAVKAVLDAELLENITLIGHSMGGYITLALAEKYPALIRAFGLFSSSAFADSEEKKATRLKAIAFIKKNGGYEFLKTSIPGLFMGEHDAIPALVERAKNFTPEALIYYYRAMIDRPDRTAVLKTFPGPILFIIGEHDKAVPFDQSLQQCYLPALSHIHILRNSAHMGMLEETDKANKALLEFLQEAT